MNKHTKLVVVILIVLLLLLVIATVSYSLDVTKDTQSTATSSNSSVNLNGNKIVQDENRLYGVVDSAGNPSIETEWEQLQFISTEYLAAAKKDGNEKTIGVLDLDGNIIAPFVYTDVHALTSSYFLATLCDTEQIVLYDSDFHAVGCCIWDSFSWQNPILTLKKGDDVYSFSLEEDVLTMQDAALVRTVGNNTFTIDLSDVNVTDLTPEEWSDTADLVQETLTVYQSQNFTTLEMITDQEHNDTVLVGMSQSDGIFHGFNVQGCVLYVQIQTNSSNGKKSITWRTNGQFSKGEESVQKTLVITMQKNQHEIWVVTNFEVV